MRWMKIMEILRRDTMIETMQPMTKIMARVFFSLTAADILPS